MKQWAYLSLVVGLLGSSTLFAQLAFQPARTISSCDTSLLTASGGALPVGDNVTAYVITPNPVIDNCAASGVPNGTAASAIITGLKTANSTLSVTAQQLLTAAGACSNAQGSGYLCVYDSNNKKTSIRFDFNTVSSVLSGPSVTVGDGRVTIGFTDSNTSNTAGYKICYGTPDQASVQDGKGKCDDYSGTSGNIVKGLINGIDYWFAAKSASGTQWLYFGPYKPVESFGFTEVYDGAENPMSWNCAQSNVPPVGGLLLLMLLLWSLRGASPFAKGGLRGILFLLLAQPLFADLGQVNLGFLGTPYRPALDFSTKPDGSIITRPFYKCMYEDKLSPLMGLEVDVHLADDFGSLQLGLGTQYTFVNGSALLSKDGCDRSNDSVRLHMLHLRPQLTYVLDPWVEYFPLVPYLRVGLVGVGYIFQYQNGWDQENKNGPGKNIGMVFGWSAAAGLMLSMKFLEPGAAARAVSNGVYDNIYLKAEAAYMPINNFYKEGLNFSPVWPRANTSFPIFLNFGLVFEFK